MIVLQLVDIIYAYVGVESDKQANKQKQANKHATQSLYPSAHPRVVCNASASRGLMQRASLADKRLDANRHGGRAVERVRRVQLLGGRAGIRKEDFEART